MMHQHGKDNGSEGFDYFGVDDEVEEVDTEPDYTV